MVVLFPHDDHTAHVAPERALRRIHRNRRSEPAQPDVRPRWGSHRLPPQRPATGGVAPRDRLPGRPRRGDARRQFPPQPRDVRRHVDGPLRRQAVLRDGRQEHGRQGRVPPDRGDRDPLLEDDRVAVELPGCRGVDRHLDDRVLRGLHARRAGAQAPLAAGSSRRRPVDREAEPHPLQRGPGVLGEVLQLLRRRGAVRADLAGAQGARRLRTREVRR